MSSRSVKPNIPEVSFRFNIPKISALKDCYSPEFIIQGTPWNVGLYRGQKNNEEYLVISLACKSKSQSPGWSRIAYISVELLSFGGQQSAFKKCTSPNVFNGSTSNWDRWLIKWTDLFDATKKYVENDMINLNVKIVVADPNDKNKSQLNFEGIGADKYRLTIKKVDNLLAVRSTEFLFQNALGSLVVYKDHKHQLGIRLESEFTGDLKMLVRLVATKSGRGSFEKVTNNSKNCSNLAIKSFISRNDVLNRQNGFIKNNSIVIEVQLEPNQSNTGIDINANNVPLPTPRFELECAICLQRFEGQQVAFTPCGHMFCSDCIKENLKANRKACPVCNKRIAITQLTRAHLPL